MSSQMNVPPKKRFGQHFLIDAGVLNRLLRHIGPTPQDNFLEIGAGHGALSQRLAPGVARLITIEIDRDCQIPLQIALSPCPWAVPKQGDILQLDIADLIASYVSPRKKIRIVGNLPYNIATRIIEKLLELPLPVRDMTFIVQLEIAQRITAMPGTRQYGYFSVRCQHLCNKVRMGFIVPPGCFIPRPKVTSAVVTLIPDGRIRKKNSEDVFIQLTKAAFSHRRKTLANSLRHHPKIGRVAGALLELAHIDGRRRAENLTVSEYEHLAQVCESNFVL